jgi:hypothetical protein
MNIELVRIASAPTPSATVHHSLRCAGHLLRNIRVSLPPANSAVPRISRRQQGDRLDCCYRTKEPQSHKHCVIVRIQIKVGSHSVYQQALVNSLLRGLANYRGIRSSAISFIIPFFSNIHHLIILLLLQALY